MILSLLLIAQAPAPVGSPAWHDYPEADALHYQVRLLLDPAAGRVEGSVEYRFRALAPLTALTLDSVAADGWDIRFEDADGQALEAVRDGARLRLQFPGGVPAEQEVRFRALLAGQPPDGLYFAKTRYGEPAVFTDHFPARARGWMPCEDHPNDRAAFELLLAAPEGFAVIASGGLEAPPLAPDWPPQGFAAHGFRTRSDLPTYLLAFAAAPFARVEEEGDPRLIPHFVYAKDVPKARRALQHHAEWMQHMEQTFGAYAYEKYTTVQIPTRWGGMENAGNTFLMQNIFDTQRAGVPILAHEFAHQWFGDAVGYADWSEVWLSEGFASYFGPWLESQTGGPPLAQAMEGHRRDWLRSPEGRAYPVRWREFPEPDAVINPNAYPKGAWVLHMLRGEIGDEAFFAGLRAYFLGNSGRAVDTPVLQAAVEKAAGRELGWFFRQWLDRPGCPELQFEWREDGVRVRQTQAGDPYRFALTLKWTGADGSEHKQRFEVREPDTSLTLAGAPIKVPVVDPDIELLFRKAG
ncbi:MAG: hypothetical protein EYC70_17010 [Planctomycetota bacterium]|nr:MAG: hypothetical protein EYC70_17010 [Planctomycetota bacterium]